MKLIVENLYGYNPTYGKTNWSIIVEAGKIDAFDYYLDNTYPDGITEAALDELLWNDQEMEHIFDVIGIEPNGRKHEKNKGST